MRPARKPVAARRGNWQPGPMVAVRSWLAPSLRKVGAAAARFIAEGRQMTLTAALECARADKPGPAWRPGPRQALTRREAQVAVLVARGLTNRDIAAQLCLSVRTVGSEQRIWRRRRCRGVHRDRRSSPSRCCPGPARRCPRTGARTRSRCDRRAWGTSGSVPPAVPATSWPARCTGCETPHRCDRIEAAWPGRFVAFPP
jgi:DNA-binding CsgD family transcriptional regulator